MMDIIEEARFLIRPTYHSIAYRTNDENRYVYDVDLLDVFQIGNNGKLTIDCCLVSKLVGGDIA